MKRIWIAACTSLLLTSPAFAEGDIDAGEKEFRKCKSCHMITADDGTEIQKGGKTGPNLYGVIGRTAGTFEDFNYGKSLVAAGEAGLVWDEETFVEYVQDPAKFLKAYLDDSKARSKMTFKLRKGMEDVYAYLESVGPQS
jgi:cytochrome c